MEPLLLQLKPSEPVSPRTFGIVFHPGGAEMPPQASGVAIGPEPAGPMSSPTFVNRLGWSPQNGGVKD